MHAGAIRPSQSFVEKRVAYALHGFNIKLEISILTSQYAEI